MTYHRLVNRQTIAMYYREMLKFQSHDDGKLRVRLKLLPVVRDAQPRAPGWPYGAARYKYTYSIPKP